MVLSFGSGMLFDTSKEETAKGVFTNRLEEAPSSDKVAFAGVETAPNTWTDAAGASVDIKVEPDEKVIVTLSANLHTVTNGEVTEMRVMRGAVVVSQEASFGSPNGAIIMVGSGSVLSLDDPGEGVHNYKVQITSSDGTGGVNHLELVAFTVGARR